jgi:hypothetical protein
MVTLICEWPRISIVEPTIRRYRDADAVSFPMFAHVVVADA